jgi:hypothetical protein
LTRLEPLYWIKMEITKEWLSHGGAEEHISDARGPEGRRGIWQPRYWEHPNQWARSHRGFATDFSDIEDSVGEPESSRIHC